MSKKKSIDTGKYNKDPEEYERLIKDLYKDYEGGIRLPPEYAHFVHKDMLRLLIRLARYKFIARLIKKTDRVLEVGCGSGLGSIFLAQHCAHVTGLDIKTTEIEEAKSINLRDNIDFIVKDLFELEPSMKFDVVCALDVIEHLEESQGRELVQKMAKHLNDDGMLIIGTPSYYSYQYQGKLSQASHVKCYDQEELVNLIEDYFGRALAFSMNDELVHTGHPKMSWFYFIIAFNPKR